MFVSTTLIDTLHISIYNCDIYKNELAAFPSILIPYDLKNLRYFDFEAKKNQTENAISFLILSEIR